MKQYKEVIKILIVYKIRNRNTGLFSKAGLDCDWGKRGRVFVSTGAYRNHLNQVGKKALTIYKDADIVEYKNGEEISIKSIIDEISEILQKKIEKENKFKELYEKEKLQREYEEYIKLKNKFENKER
jgi:hypothetical protein